jgi:hypothetical protein
MRMKGAKPARILYVVEFVHFPLRQRMERVLAAGPLSTEIRAKFLEQLSPCPAPPQELE